jgi:RNA polymerase sigma factor (sigma-70 family)
MNHHPTSEYDPTDADVIRDSLNSPTSFAQLFERHFAAVHRYIAQRLGRDLADELGAQTFLVAFDRRSRYDAGNLDARAWLLGIATNLIRHHWRAERRWLGACERVSRGIPQDQQDANAPAGAGLDQNLVASLRSLPRRDRETLLLLAWAELSYEEIAAALGVPLGTVRSRINRARRRMSESLGRAAANSAKPADCPTPRTARDQGDCSVRT